jgi:hypothetical protein
MAPFEGEADFASDDKTYIHFANPFMMLEKDKLMGFSRTVMVRLSNAVNHKTRRVHAAFTYIETNIFDYSTWSPSTINFTIQ